jgi:hypothetical protein
MGTSVAWVRAGGELALPLGSHFGYYQKNGEPVKKKGNTKKKGSSPQWTGPGTDAAVSVGVENRRRKLGKAAEGQPFAVRGHSPLGRDSVGGQTQRPRYPIRLGNRLRVRAMPGAGRAGEPPRVPRQQGRRSRKRHAPPPAGSGCRSSMVSRNSGDSTSHSNQRPETPVELVVTPGAAGRGRVTSGRLVRQPGG